MVKARGILNTGAVDALRNSASTSGLIRSREFTPKNFIFDTNTPVVHMQKSNAVVNGQGRLQFAANSWYIPAYTIGVGAAVGSGYTTTSAGIYLVEGMIACSGDFASLPPEIYAGAALVDGAPASGTETFALGAVTNAGTVPLHIRGVVHADVGSVINIGAKTVYGTLISVGHEELVNAPAATLTVMKLPSDELTFSP